MKREIKRLSEERDIRAKINPQYADTPGTESYERKCLLDEIDRLRGALDNLEIHATRDMVSGWVCVPEIEWNSVYTSVYTNERPDV